VWDVVDNDGGLKSNLSAISNIDSPPFSILSFGFFQVESLNLGSMFRIYSIVLYFIL
jgi:hypothetical protein